MDAEIRPIAAEESEALIRAVATGFGTHLSDADLEYEKAIIEVDRALAAVDGGEFVGGLAGLSMELTVPGGIVPCAGVTSVSVLPSHRRRGILTALTRRFLDEVRGREPISALWASEGPIYGRFGYGVATLAGRFRIEQEQSAFAEAHEPSGRVALIDKDQAMKAFPEIYERLRPHQPGFTSRTATWWPYRFHIHHDFLRDGFGDYFFALHEGREGPDGYVAYRVKGEWKDGSPASTLDVEELIADSPSAAADLWRYCFDMDLVAEITGGARPADDPLLHMLAHPRRLRLRVGEGLWVRLVDLPRALSERHYAQEGAVAVEVRDAFCPWNEGRWLLEASPEGASCEPTNQEPGIVLGAADLGAAYLGGISLRALARAGRVREERDGSLATADRMLAWDPPPWCPEIF